MSKTQSHEFQAEIKQLMDLMVHSLYTHKDIFLRELISNSSDALDRLRFQKLTDETIAGDDELEIRLRIDSETRTLFISDNGIGMTRDELVENLGTIARSGTKEFLQTVQTPGGQNAPDLIGQFGVGFYSSFMVADRVEVLARKVGAEEATLWRSSGDGTYTVEVGERETSGTTVILHLKTVDEDNGVFDYTDEFVLKGIVKKYSDFVSYPIRMKSKDGDETINSMKAIWARPKEEVTEDEYKEFYKHISHDWTDPLAHISVKMEGAVEARALLYIPSKAPMDLYHQEMSYHGVQLYASRVFIMDECKDLMPRHLRFIKGVVDSEDLSLNVSREILQKDRQISAIRKFLVRKIMEELKHLKKDENENYLTFWSEFGPVLKEGLLDYNAKHDALLDLMLCPSSKDSSELTTLADYVGRMKEEQENIYYMVGSSRSVLESSPQIEKLVSDGYEVLFFTDRVDEVWLQQPPEFDGKQWQSVGHGEVEIGSDADKEKARIELDEKARDYKDLLQFLLAQLNDHVKEVRLSSRLASSAACLVGDTDDMTPQMVAMLREMGQEVPEVKRILELNPGHELVIKLQARFDAEGGNSELEEMAGLLFGQAVLAEGGKLPDPAAFSRSVAKLMIRAVQ